MKKLIILGAVWLVGCATPKDQKSESENLTKKPVKSAIELIGEVASDSIKTLYKDRKVDFYQWKDHLLIFGEVSALDTTKISGTGKIKYYEMPVYRFEKAFHCENKTQDEQWQDYVLIANLVEDRLKQQEYLEYHRVQFEQWPEIASGFCNADFQRLCVYKNERQLLLVISVPADKTLDELNPRTVENNPRMDEWNKIMAQYQEGVPGTAPGETWVFMDQL